MNLEHISVHKFRDMIDDEKYVILDVRTEDEFKEGHLENSQLIDFYSDNFRDELAKLDKDKEYLVYCHSGGRSGKCMNMMGELGFKNVYNMAGGILDWTANQYEVTK
ncbi:rhodanese-like domain-containing protein [soil metagenome]